MLHLERVVLQKVVQPNSISCLPRSIRSWNW